MPPAPPPLPVIPPAKNLDEVVDGIDAIIAWSISASSRLGYFAALYKRITLAVKVAIADGAFENAARMERFDVAFANRYLDAINAHFHPAQFGRPTRSWRTTFAGADDPEPIMLQHMLVGINAHISLDLGIAAQTIGGSGDIRALQEDFNRINAVLASQVNGIVEDINELSPALADIYAVLQQNQIFVINEALKTMRDNAWRFATVLALQPGFTRPITIGVKDFSVARQNELIFDPPGVVGLIDWAVKAIAERESRDVVHNIEVLDEIAAVPAPIATTM
jgi:Family of unknown function (DUF5995)